MTRGEPPRLLHSLERGLSVGLLLGTAAAALLAARNGFAPLQAPLTFGLVFWKWLVLAGLALALPAGLLAWVAARLSGVVLLPRLAAGVLVAGFFGLVLAFNVRALGALADQPGPLRYRVLLPAAACLATLGLGLAVSLAESRRGSLRLVTLLALAACLGAFYPGGAPARTVRADGRRPAQVAGPGVLVVGIDGATWDLAEPLIARGELPHLAALRARGAWGRLKSFEPTSSPVIWTTIVTGKPSDEHGVRGFTHTRLRGVQQALPALRPLKRMGFSWFFERLTKSGEVYQAPITSAVRKVPAFWNIASAHGSRVAVVNWWATWPAEPVLGQLVSERTYYAVLDGDADAGRQRLTYPEDLYPEVARLQMQPHQTAYDDALRFVDLTPEEFEAVRSIRTTNRTDIEGGLTYFFSLHESTRRVARRLIQAGRTQFGQAPDTLVLFRIVDLSCHTSIQHSELVQEHLGASPAQLRKYGRVVSEAYRAADHALGDLLEAFGDGDVIVLSDHGWALQGDGTYGHRKAPDGLFVAAGPAFRHSRVEGLSVYDVLPLLLRLKGFPVAQDLPGRVPDEAFDAAFLVAHPLRTVDTYGRREDVELAAGSTAVDEEMLERLRALGYVQ